MFECRNHHQRRKPCSCWKGRTVDGLRRWMDRYVDRLTKNTGEALERMQATRIEHNIAIQLRKSPPIYLPQAYLVVR